MEDSVQDERDPGRATARPVRRPAPSMNRVIWRWHFWVGMLVCPVLIIASITGAIYIFKKDLEMVFYPELMGTYLEASPADLVKASLVEQVAAAQEVVGKDWIPDTIEIGRRRPRANSVYFTNEKHEHRRIYIDPYWHDPYGLKCLGEMPKPNLFTVSLEIHRRLFMGSFGRALVEITTCWTVLLTLTGCYLWWPRNFRKLNGVFFPRLRGKRYVMARDLHALPGVLFAPVIITIAVSGLLYSLAWGTTFLTVGFVSGSFDISIDPPKSIVPEERQAVSEGVTEVTPDHVWQLAKEHNLPDDRVSIRLVKQPTDSFSYSAGDKWGPSVTAVMHVDQYTGKVIGNARLAELPWMAQWTQWNYPLHVGSIIGLTSKIIWLVACLIMTALPATGIWMWLTRRKKGSLGLPKKLEQPLPRWLWAAIVLAGLVFPLAGVTMLLALFYEWIQFLLSKRAAN